MRCVFCKQDSSTSKSLEHIIPESLGNKQHVLPKGMVCDKCNQYFAIKVEKKFLEEPFFENLRFRYSIESKKRRIPATNILVPITRERGRIHVDKNRHLNINLEKASFNAIANGQIKKIYIPIEEVPILSSRNISRFLAKAGLETLAQRLYSHQGGIDYIIDESQLDDLRNYARYDVSKETWVFHFRKVYNPSSTIAYQDGKFTELLFEYDIHITPQLEYYFILIIMGYEFAINLRGSSIEGYLTWLEENNYISPLYKEKVNNFNGL